MGQPIPKEAQEYAKRLMRKLEDLFPNQTAIGKALGITQTHVSQIKIAGNAGPQVLMKMATLAGEDKKEASRVLSGEEGFEDTDSPFENARRLFERDAEFRGETSAAETFLKEFLQTKYSQMPALGPGQWYEELRRHFDAWKMYGAPKGRKL